MTESVSPDTSLQVELQSGRVQPDDALHISEQIGEALAEAHDAGRIHGNLNSANVLVRKDSAGLHVSVTGFGGESPTLAGLDHLSLDHLAPERKDGGPPTIAADIYSFGRILEQIRNGARLENTRSAAWDAAAHRCLDPLPGNRFHSARGVLQAIGLSEVTASISSGEIARQQAAKKWGDFQLLQRLGEGGFGEVYRAWDPILEREVALKFVLHPGMNPDQEYETMIAEARAIARVRHPNIVSVYGVDRKDGRVGFWSDYVRGQTLTRLVETQGPRSAKETTEIGIVLCDALTAVHHAGLLHRDIKSSNAMRDENGRILLMDFGLSAELHQPTAIAGTKDYMAPELFAGHTPSVQSDIYAMGVLLLFLCTGKYAREGQDKGQNKTPDVQIPATIPSGLQEVIRTARSVDPDKRYSSAATMREALAATLTSPATANASPRQSRKKLIVAAIILGAIIIGLLGFLPLIRKEARARLAGTNTAAYQDFLAAEEALQRYDKPGNTEKAISLYKQTLERSPNFALAEAGLARADWRMYVDTSDTKWVEAASEASAKAAAINPNLAPVQMTLGIIHVEQGKAGLGMQELEQAKQLDSRSADVHAALGEAYRQQGRITDAKNELQTAMDLAPDQWRWPYLLGALQIDSGDFAAADVSLKTALEKTPDNARVLYDLGLSYRKQGKLDDAGQMYEQSLKLDPRIETMMALGMVSVLQQRYDDAVRMYKRATEMSPNEWEVWANLAAAWEWTGRNPQEVSTSYAKAADLASQQLKATPDDAYLVSKLANIYAGLRDSGRALPLLRKSLVLAPNDPDVLARVAEGYEELGDREQALRLIDKALRLGFSPDYAKKAPAFRALRNDPRAPSAIRGKTTPPSAKSKGGV